VLRPLAGRAAMADHQGRGGASIGLHDQQAEAGDEGDHEVSNKVFHAEASG